MALTLHLLVALWIDFGPETTASLPSSSVVLTFEQAQAPVAAHAPASKMERHEPQSEPVPLKESDGEADVEPDMQSAALAEQSASAAEGVVAEPTAQSALSEPAPVAGAAASDSSSVITDEGAALQYAQAARATYVQRLAAWLDRYKEYPARARRMGMEGEVLVNIRISDDGAVQAFTIERAAAYGVLTDTVRRMVALASPFPAVPREMRTAEFRFSVPVRFALGHSTAR